MRLTLKWLRGQLLSSGTVPSVNRQWGLGNEVWQSIMVVHMGGLGGTIMLQSVDGKGTRTNALGAT